MIDMAKFHQRAEGLSEMLQARLGVRGKSLKARLSRAGRRLPKAQRRAGKTLIETERLLGHPKLARLADPVETDRAFDTITGHLKRFDRAEARRNALLTWLAVVVFNLLLLGGLVVALVRWQGPL
ncbi:hypothetical protein [Roseovarius indicus]|uniref:hypothetical protein n=1 Tax=Roseovarius indicus TaxID=540747 RepID=UPI0007D98EDE|nr:hypothetical protein [Roseovarius indicus]OAO03325.1 hypothetical protein A8B76_22080 [Roseovarius indicus]